MSPCITSFPGEHPNQNSLPTFASATFDFAVFDVAKFDLEARGYSFVTLDVLVYRKICLIARI